MKEKQEEYITRPDSNGDPVIIRNPYYFKESPTSGAKKIRNKHTNLTPKKKKRKR